MNQPTETDRPTVIMAFRGVRQDRKGKAEYVWIRLDAADKALEDPEDYSRMTFFAKQIQKGATPGAVYEIQLNPEKDGSFYINTGTYQGRYVDDEVTARWQTLHHAARQQLAEDKSVAKELKRRLDLERLEPFRWAYMNSSGTKRAHILALVVKAVTSPSPLK